MYNQFRITGALSNMEQIIHLQQNEFGNNIRDHFRRLKEDQELFDVTLVTDDGQHFQSHKIILSAGSHFFSDIFLKSNHMNLVIYLKGINSVDLTNAMEFIYNGEVSINQENLEQFIETGKDLQIKGLDFQNRILDISEIISEQSDTHEDSKEKIIEENEHTSTNDNKIQDANEELFPESAETSDDVAKTQGKDLQLGKKEDLNNLINIQTQKIIKKKKEKWECQVCGKTSFKKQYLQRHAETHIGGMSYVCPICNKTFSTKNNMRSHMSHIHTESFSCKFCEKTGMNKAAYYMHKQRNHALLVDSKNI